MTRAWLLLVAALVVAPAAADAKPKKSRSAEKKKKQKEKEADEKRKADEAEAERILEEEAKVQAEADAAAAQMAAEDAAAKAAAEPAPGIEEGTASASAAATAPAAKQQRLYVRAGVAHVAPLAVSRELELADVTGPASLAVQDGPIEGSGATVSSATIPALIIGYRFRPRWALETVLGLPFTVTFRATGTLANESLAPMALGIPTGVPPLGPELGTAKAAPPVVTAVYDILGRGKLRPYAGGGLAMLLSFDTHVTNPILLEVEEPEMHISPAPGVVLQGGVETRLTGRFYARLDVKFIALMLARAEVTHIQVRTPELPLFDTVEVGTAKMSVWVNPLIVQAGVGADF